MEGSWQRRILHELKQVGRPMSVNELIHATRFPRFRKHDFIRSLNGLMTNGKVVIHHMNRDPYAQQYKLTHKRKATS